MPYWQEALAVTSRFLFWFLILPYLLMPKTLPWTDRLVYGFATWASGAIVFIQFLSAAGVYDPIAVWGLLLAVAVIGIIRWRSRQASWGHIWMRTLDWLEERQGTWFRMAAAAIPRVYRRGTAALVKAVTHPDLLVWMLGCAILGWAAWLRYYPYLEKAYLGISQGYQHLTWTKYLERHAMFSDGLYPFGYHAIVAALGSLTYFDRFLLFRFIGPIGGVLLVLSIGYAGVRLRLRAGAIVAAVALFGLGLGSPLPADSFLQSHPLPTEFAAIFLLPTTVLGWQYLKDGERRTGLMAALLLFCAAAIHPYTLIYFGGALIIFAISSVLTKSLSPVRFGRTMLVTGATAGLACLPLFVGRLAGKAWSGSFSLGLSGPQTQPLQWSGSGLISANFFIDLGMLLSIVLILLGIIGAMRQNRETAFLDLSIGLMLAVLLTQVYGWSELPLLLDPIHAGLVFSLFLALAAGLLLHRVLTLVPWRRLDVLVVGGLVAAQAATWWPKPNHSLQLEYEDAVKAFVAITENYPRMMWTVVGPVEQYSQVLNIGWHEELGRFLLRTDVAQVGRPDFALYIPTPDIFVYVEKVPLYNEEHIQPDLHAPVNFAGIDDPNVLYTRYQDPTERKLMQQRIWGIVEAYAGAHPNEVSIFFEAPQLRVYHIHHELSIFK